MTTGNPSSERRVTDLPPPPRGPALAPDRLCNMCRYSGCQGLCAEADHEPAANTLRRLTEEARVTALHAAAGRFADQPHTVWTGREVAHILRTLAALTDQE